MRVRTKVPFAIINWSEIEREILFLSSVYNLDILHVACRFIAFHNLNQASVDLLLSVVSMVPGLIKVVGMLPH